MKHRTHTKKIVTKHTVVTVTTQSGQPDKITIRAAKDTRLEMSCPDLKLDPVEPTLPNIKEVYRKMQEAGILLGGGAFPVHEPGYFLEDEDH
jgi:biotin synthase-related radical SAM superfamily protein